MGQRAVYGAVAAVAAALLLLPSAAAAGAPNFDCVVGKNARLAVDQWAGVVAATGFAPGPTIWGVADNVDQALLLPIAISGPSLDLVAKLRGESWRITIRDEGKSLVVTRPEGTLTGHCRFIPGSFVLRAADNGGFALRAGASAQARRLLPIPVGTAVWQRPDRQLKGDWFPVSTFVARARSLSAFDGWLRQHKPLVSH